MRILIAEDDAALQYMARKLMGRWGYSFDIASNGQEAVEQAQMHEGEYDLCLMDIDMPIMNGFEATKIIRQKLKYFPIMALTSHSMSKDKFLEMGMDDFLGKPYGMDELYGKINQLTIKSLKIHNTQDQIRLRKEIPMNQEELQELRELDKRGLTKFSVVSDEIGYKFVTHKNIQNKISHDFIAKGKKISEFLDRSEDDPGIIHLYASKDHRINKRYLLPEHLEELASDENEEMANYTSKAEFPEKENP